MLTKSVEELFEVRKTNGLPVISELYVLVRI